MSAATIASSAENMDRFFLRWSDSPDLPIREEPVEVVRLDASELIIRSALRVGEATRVFLIGNQYTGNGIVRSCHQEGDSFLLTIHISSEYDVPELPGYDPGMFAVDDFLTEEEEAKILGSLERDSQVQRQRSCQLSRLLLFVKTACDTFGLHNIHSCVQFNPQ